LTEHGPIVQGISTHPDDLVHFHNNRTTGQTHENP
jgi:hypothetical protein